MLGWGGEEGGGEGRLEAGRALGERVFRAHGGGGTFPPGGMMDSDRGGAGAAGGNGGDGETGCDCVGGGDAAGGGSWVGDSRE